MLGKLRLHEVGVDDRAAAFLADNGNRRLVATCLDAEDVHMTEMAALAMNGKRCIAAVPAACGRDAGDPVYFASPAS
jgi:hypothetical protein